MRKITPAQRKILARLSEMDRPAFMHDLGHPRFHTIRYLRSVGLIAHVNSNPIVITDAGREALKTGVVP